MTGAYSQEPWGPFGALDGTEDYAVRDGSHRTIATVRRLVKFPGVEDEEGIVNLKLIAAAPAMARELESAASWLESSFAMSPIERAGKVAQLRACLRKAGVA